MQIPAVPVKMMTKEGRKRNLPTNHNQLKNRWVYYMFDLPVRMARINMERGTEKQRLPIFGCEIYVQGNSFASIFLTVKLNSSINH
jgi:hypothetical protein